MTDNDIIKALECHADPDVATCEECPMLNIRDCAYKVSKNALDLINRQKAEIERLSKLALERHTHIYNLNSEIEKLRKTRYSDAKAEAIKEFAERLKYKFPDGLGAFNSFDVMEIVDDLAKEMVGD